MGRLNQDFRIRSITTISSMDVCVPDNIMVIEGNNTEIRSRAFDILSEHPSVNSVVMLGNPDETTQDTLSNLFANSHLQDGILKYDPPNNSLLTSTSISSQKTNQIILGNQNTYINRVSNTLNDTPQDIYDLWQNSFVYSSEEKETNDQKILNSRLLTWGYYVNKEAKIHIDTVTIKPYARMIDCITGRGTLLFDSNDFTIKGQAIRQTPLFTNAWAITEGSSVLIREPTINKAMVSNPAIHAHAIQTEPQARAIIRTDYEID